MPIDDIPAPNLGRAKRAQYQLVAGGSSSLVEVLCFMPLDLVKTRLQLQKNTVNNGKSHYKGVFDAFTKIYQQEGIISFWRGLVPPIVSDMPRRAVKFLVFEQAKPYFLFGAPNPTALTYVLAGAVGGTVEGFLQTPFEVIKITQQANRKKNLSTIRVARNIIKKDGFGFHGLYRGVTTTMVRNGTFHIFFFGIFCTVRDATPVPKHFVWDFLRKWTIAFLSGSIGVVFSAPFDMAKSRIQGPQPVPGLVKYSYTFSTIATVCREEGKWALYKGFLPQLMRSGPASAILLLGYEYIYAFLLRKYV